MTSSDQRRKQLARQKYERQLQRRAEARRRAKRRNVIIAAALAVVLAGGAAAWAAGHLVDDSAKDQAADAPSATPSASATKKVHDPCAKPAAGKVSKAQWKKEPAMNIDKSASYTMKLQTTCGEIDAALDAKNAPHTVNSFDFLTGKHFLDHSPCHRLVDQGIYVLQCGDPTGTGTGGPGYTIPDENLKAKEIKGGTYPAGTLAMANTYNPQTKQGRNSGGSQFFLVYKDSPLPADYTPFGKITKGMDVLQKIAKAGAAADPQTMNTAPNATVVINKATVDKG
ncbi:peptidylprolyl isomerase [Streptomyces sp. NPDC059740]|uniref:peptidylprolyl isomerase n=1 Tax=Streptomyces sp. NPDC059740 TaxID=3346926 RepID=UPI00364F5799